LLAFWTMIVQQGVKIIAMLANVVEERKQKCEQ
jgi:hypothetical protein